MNPLYQLDHDLFRALHDEFQRDWLDPVMVVLTDTGRGEVYIGVLVVLSLFAKYRNYALMALSAGCVSGLFAQLLKNLVERDRPGNLPFAEPITTYIEALMGQSAPTAASSFPSGHATSAFAIAVCVAWVTRKSDHAWIGWAVMGWAVLVAFSRVYVGVHFFSDVLAGAAVGTLFGTLAFLLWKKKGWVVETRLDGLH
jgi:undecaprenyl-diphosphatase